MSFKDFAVKKLVEAQEMFGTYSYGDKGPSEVMDVDGITAEFKKVDKKEAIEQLWAVANDTSTKLDPTYLIQEVLCSLGNDSEYEFIFTTEAGDALLKFVGH